MSKDILFRDNIKSTAKKVISALSINCPHTKTQRMSAKKLELKCILFFKLIDNNSYFYSPSSGIRQLTLRKLFEVAYLQLQHLQVRTVVNKVDST